jgi:hypothetical protein
MTLTRSILAGLAAAGLLVAQTAAAAIPARTSADIGQSEEVAGAPGAGPVVGAILLVLVIFGIMALTDDDEDGFPISP